MTRFIALAVALAAITAPAAGAQAGRTVTLHLVEKDMSFHVVDNPPASESRGTVSPGDTFQFSSALLTRDHRRAGTLRATCTVVTGGSFPKAASVCVGGFGLKGGELVVQATVRFTSGTSRIAIVGGTGAYAGARGEVISKSRGENSPFSDDTVRLTLP